MANRKEIDNLLADIQTLDRQVAAMREAEFYPASFFEGTFQLTHKILKDLHALENLQIEALREFCIRSGKPDMDIEVDGGITEENVDAVIEAGANVIVAGSTVFRSQDMAWTIKRLHGRGL